MAATRDSMTSDFGVVKKVVPRRWMHMIKVNAFLEKNRVYVEDADFDFVYNYIYSHCPQAQK